MSRKKNLSDFRRMIQNGAEAYLTELMGQAKGKEAAVRTGLAFSQAVRATKNPSALMSCDPASVIACTAMSAMTGLMPGGPNPMVWLIPKKGELNWWLSHRGITTLLYRAGFHIRSVPVHVDDDHHVEFGEMISHTSTAWPDSLKEIAGVYLVIRRLEDGLVLSRPFLHVDAIVKRKKQGGPVWSKWPVEMAQKTAIKWAMARGELPLDDPSTQVAMAHDGDSIDATADVVSSAPVEQASESSQGEVLGLPDYGGEDELEGVSPTGDKVRVQNEDQEAAL